MRLEQEQALKLLRGCLTAAQSSAGSDIHLRTNRVAYLRDSGKVSPIGGVDSLRSGTWDALMTALLSQRDAGVDGGTSWGSVKIRIKTEKRFDFGFGTEGMEGEGVPPMRLRCQLFLERNGYAMVMRRMNDKILEIDQVIPDFVRERIFRDLEKPEGLFLVTGPTGSGKTTTLASILNTYNVSVSHHLITIEDPIELVYPQYYEAVPGSSRYKSLVTQREVGVHVNSFMDGVHQALRQDFNTVLVGETRGADTMQAILLASETGHRVFSSMHTNGAVASISRIVKSFPADLQASIVRQLSENLIGVLAQKLLPRTDGCGRVLCCEYLSVRGAVRTALYKGNYETLPQIAVNDPGNFLGWNGSLKLLREGGEISQETYDANRRGDDHV